jgi:large subunit ribosomal protein L30
MSKVKITQKKSTIGTKPKTKATVKALGLRRISDSVVLENTDAIKGMIHKVSHLVEVEDA